MSKNLVSFGRYGLRSLLLIGLGAFIIPGTQAGIDIAQVPLFLGGNSTPLVMMVMGRDHKLYYEAYNDASDLDGDGELDVGYKPDKITYFGYFDSNKCYTSDGSLFTPSGAATNKKCSGQWSGDFLNYLTMSRMDALRRVLYGGYRSTDTDQKTILERSYIPQDAHSWGKEYTSETVDGYKISDYTPYPEPVQNVSDGKVRRHLFANTTPLCPGNYKDPACESNSGLPLLRVAENSIYRVWEWLSIERPVAGLYCATGNNNRALCVTGNIMGSWSIVTSSVFSDLTRTFYKVDTSKYYKDASGIDRKCDQSPQNDVEFGNFENSCKSTGLGTSSISDINCNSSTGTCYPNTSNKDRFMTIFEGKLKITEDNYYEFGADGDDAVEILINDKAIGDDGGNDDPREISGYYKAHGFCGTPSELNKCQKPLGGVTLKAGKEYKLKFRHQDQTGGDGYALSWRKATGVSKLTDYVVRVQSCKTADEAECRGYPAAEPTSYKPAGLLQQYGEDDPERMAFGLISGSYAKNTSGGVVRKNIGAFAKPSDVNAEVDPATGIFKTKNDALVPGIISTLSGLKILGFGGNYEYGSLGNKGCGWITTRAIAEGECRMWGNPIGEMMYEALRYFAGKPNNTTPEPLPTVAFDYSETSDSGKVDASLKLPKPTWVYPFKIKKDPPYSGPNYSGTKCFTLTIGDLTPSFDTDQVTGSYFNAFSGDLDIQAQKKADEIWAGEPDDNANKVKFIGQSGTVVDGAPTPKTVSGFGNIRGLAPEEPTKQGGFYSAASAFFGNTQGIGGTSGKQRVENLSVALASPLPRIEIPVGEQHVVLVPFAKSVGGSSIDPAEGKFQPTNQIVDFYVEKIDYADPDNGGRPHGSFRINYEDVEQGADHDMDAIVRYEFWVQADNTVKLSLSSTYAAGGIIQHMGYIISGTDSQDGVYLDVRDSDTGTASDPDYYLDTPVATTTNTDSSSATYQHTLPRSAWPTDYWKHTGSSGPLPLEITRIFKPGTTTAAQYIKHDPLWYAAKWGGFNDKDKDGLPDLNEWDDEPVGGDGVPDNYFLVTNAGKLKEQLGKAFAKIQGKTGTASVVAVQTGKAYGDGDLYQAQFDSKDWSGRVVALGPLTKATGTLAATQRWDAGVEINKLSPGSREVLTYKPSEDKGVPFLWADLDLAQQQALSDLNADGTYNDSIGKDRLDFLRGENSKEGKDAFRQRSSDLGDIVNSSPAYVSRPNLRYDMKCGSTDYSTFRAANTERNRMVYVGSNDGMLHGFDAGSKDLSSGLFSSGTGLEKIAYVPSAVFNNLKLLTKPSYNTVTTGSGASVDTTSYSEHRYYVDSKSIISDACLNSEWHSVLIGRLGAGGRGVFALDVTDPAQFSEDNAKNLVLWEITAADDPDLGYTFGGSWIVKMNSDQWAAVFGNGYNSDELTGFCSDDLPVGDGCEKHDPPATPVRGSGNAVLFIVNVGTGKVIKKIPVPAPTVCSDDLPIGDGCSQHSPPASPINSVGLSSPYIYDIDGDGKTDWIYAGDMAGNMWKFDVRDSNSSEWKVELLFTAKNASGVRQPITSPPVVMGHPEGGTLVLFGTGRYLGNNDLANRDGQSYYGVWDREYWGLDKKWGTDDDVAFDDVGSRTDLLAQTFDAVVTTIEGKTYRTSSSNQICWSSPSAGSCTFICREDMCGTTEKGKSYTVEAKYLGWYIDLPYTTADGGNERVYDDSELLGGRISFDSKAPTQKDPTAPILPCDSVVPEGKSWHNLLDALSGRRLSTSFIKVDQEGKQTALKDASGKAPSSLQMEGITTGGSTTSGQEGVDYQMIGTTNPQTGNVEIEVIGIQSSSERQSWKQLEFQGK